MNNHFVLPPEYTLLGTLVIPANGSRGATRFYLAGYCKGLEKYGTVRFIEPSAGQSGQPETELTIEELPSEVYFG